MKNFSINDNNNNKFFTLKFIKINNKFRSKIFVVIKYNKIKITIKNSIDKNVKIYAFLDL